MYQINESKILCMFVTPLANSRFVLCSLSANNLLYLEFVSYLLSVGKTSILWTCCEKLDFWTEFCEHLYGLGWFLERIQLPLW